MFLPVVGPEGWLTEPSKILRMAFDHMYVSDYDQSDIYKGNITSLQYIMSLYPKDIDKTIELLTESINKYMLRYFENADISIIDITPNENEALRTLEISINVTAKDGKIYSLGAAISETHKGSGVFSVLEETNR